MSVSVIFLRLFGAPCARFAPLALSISQGADFVRESLNDWDHFIFETLDNSAGILFVDSEGHNVAVIY